MTSGTCLSTRTNLYVNKEEHLFPLKFLNLLSVYVRQDMSSELPVASQALDSDSYKNTVQTTIKSTSLTQSLLDLRDIITFVSMDTGLNPLVWSNLLKHMEKYPQKESYACPIQSSLSGWRERFKDFYYHYPWLILLHFFLIQGYLVLHRKSSLVMSREELQAISLYLEYMLQSCLL